MNIFGKPKWKRIIIGISIIFFIMSCAGGGKRVMLKQISSNTPQEKNNVFAVVDLYPNKSNKIIVFMWQKHDLFGVYRIRHQEPEIEIGEITPNSRHNASNVLAEVWDEGSTVEDRYKVCINKNMNNCIPINYWSSDSTLIEKYQ